MSEVPVLSALVPKQRWHLFDEAAETFVECSQASSLIELILFLRETSLTLSPNASQILALQQESHLDIMAGRRSHSRQKLATGIATEGAGKQFAQLSALQSGGEHVMALKTHPMRVLGVISRLLKWKPSWEGTRVINNEHKGCNFRGGNRSKCNLTHV